MNYLAQIQTAIHRLHGCEATYVETVPVKEVFKGQTAWEGEVEVFEISGHATAKRCYAWGYPSDRDPKRIDVVSVLELPPVDSPQTAVKAAIASHARASRDAAKR